MQGIANVDKVLLSSILTDTIVFVLSKALGYFFPEADSLVFYVLAKKTLKLSRRGSAVHRGTEEKVTIRSISQADKETIEILISSMQNTVFLSV